MILVGGIMGVVSLFLLTGLSVTLVGVSLFSLIGILCSVIR